MGDGCYLNHLSIHDYATEAFCFDPSQPSGYGQGGIYAGSGSAFADPNDRHVAAKARFINIAPGKLFVRWVDSWFLGQGWEAAAGGAWWSSDNMGEQIVRATVARFGPSGNTSLIAREFSNVGYTWTGVPGDRGAVGTFRSDMGAVVACRTTVPIKILMGIGRPVLNPTLIGGKIHTVEMASDELQIVMLTKWKGKFRGNEFLKREFFGSSSEFTRWWLQHQPVQARRSAQVASFRGR